jgi:hypothetical protein
MRKLTFMTILASLLFTQSSFANYTKDDFSNKHCDAIADICKQAGFTNEDMGDKSFWFGCMKPLLYGKTVNGLTVDAKEVKECRKAKIAKMQQEIKALKAVK